MANAKNLEMILKGSVAWNEWRIKNPHASIQLNGAMLAKANLQGINLSRANLSEANLQGANLKGGNLHEANLREADLYEADLSEANLSGADLCETDLSQANLREAILSETFFNGANLRGTLISGAYLNDVSFSGASFNDTQLTRVDLGSVIGLESSVHDGPSSIGIDTIFLSQGKIPEVFLRGCGVPEEFITYLPSLINKPIEFYSCFISYSHGDKAFARQLHDYLQGRGIRCWLDEHQLLPGHDIFEEVDRGIKMWDKVLLCASKDSLTSWWVTMRLIARSKKSRP